MKHKLPDQLKDRAVFLETQGLLAFGNGGQALGGLVKGGGSLKAKSLLQFQTILIFCCTYKTKHIPRNKRKRKQHCS